MTTALATATDPLQTISDRPIADHLKIHSETGWVMWKEEAKAVGTRLTDSDLWNVYVASHLKKLQTEKQFHFAGTIKWFLLHQHCCLEFPAARKIQAQCRTWFSKKGKKEAIGVATKDVEYVGDIIDLSLSGYNKQGIGEKAIVQLWNRTLTGLQYNDSEKEADFGGWLLKARRGKIVSRLNDGIEALIHHSNFNIQWWRKRQSYG